MIYVDSHVHTRHSSDGKDPVRAIVDEAREKGLYYLATTDHLDLDLKLGHNRSPIPWKHIDLAAYRAEWLEARAELEKEDSPLKFRFGIEAGFSDEPQVMEAYRKVLADYPFDVVINSVHFVDGWDVYFPNAFFLKSRKRIYGDYLDEMGEAIVTVHLSDVNEEGRMCLPGRGTFDFETLFRRLADVGFRGAMLIEAYQNDYGTESELKDSLCYLRELAEKIFP